MAASRPKSTAYQGSLAPFAPPPAWIWPFSALLCWLLALFLALAFIGHEPAGQKPHFLGLTGSALSGVLLTATGWAAWVLVGCLVLAGIYLWREKQAAALVWLAGGGLWLAAGLGVVLGFFGDKTLGGQAGAALASALSGALPAPLDWLIPVLVATLGLGVVGWSMWPVIIGLPDMLNLPGLPRPRTEEADSEDQAPAEPPEETDHESAAEEALLAQAEPEETPPPTRLEDGPRIKPRLEAPQAKTVQQEKLSFGNAKYRLPTLDLLQEPQDQTAPDQAESLKYNSRLLEKKLADFGVQGQVVEGAPGPRPVDTGVF